LLPVKLRAFLLVFVVLSWADRLHAQATFDLTAIASPGDAAPVPPTLVRARFPSLGDGGQVAFSADGGVFLQSGDQQIVVAAYGDPAPGGGTFLSAGGSAPPSINAQGQTVFTGQVTPPGVNGIFLYSSGVTTRIVGEGDSAPGGGAFRSLTSPLLNDSGQVAFLSVRGAAGIFLFSQDGVARLVSVGDPAPGGGTFRSFSSLSLNSNGHVVFRGDVSGGAAGIFLVAGTTVTRIVTTSDPAAKGSLNDAGQVAYVLGQGAVGAYLFSQGQVTTLALAGDPAPGGGSFTSFDSPSVNAAGQTAFTGVLSTGISGVFLFSEGGVTSVMHPGDGSPDGDTFTYGETPAMNAQGQVAFTGRLLNSVGGVYLFSQGAIVRIAGQGDVVPRAPMFWEAFFPVINGAGTVVFTGELFPGVGALFDQNVNRLFGGGDPAPQGGAFTTFGIPPAVNDGGQLAFVGASSRSNTFDLFLSSNGALVRVAANGDSAPGGGMFTDFGSQLLSMDNSGRIAADAAVLAPGRSGLFLFSYSDPLALVQVGDAAPGGGTFDQIGPGSMNGAGQVVFQAIVTSPGRSGIFSWSGGSTSSVAQTGDAAPGGGTFVFDALNFDFAPSVNASGSVAFGAGLSTGGEGVFLFGDGAITTVARPGDPAPGGGSFTNAYTASLNDPGQVVFVATTPSVTGVFFLSGGTVTRIAATGDATPGGDTFTYAGDPTVNTLGEVAFDGGLASGSVGTFLAKPRSGS
jgi:hypothetical protein